MSVVLELVFMRPLHKPVWAELLTCLVVYAVGGYLYNFFEPGFTIVAACMPILRKVVKDIIQWKKDTPTSNWISTRRNKRATQTVLPLNKCPGDSAFADKNVSEKTDTTLATTTGPTVINTKLLPTSCCACVGDTKPSEPKERCIDLQHVA